MSIGNKLKLRRTAMQLSQAELARLAGISQQAVAALEAGTSRKSKFLPEIARALNMTVEELEGDELAPAIERRPVPDIDFRALPRDVPVLGQVVGGDNGDFRFNGQVIDYLRRPPGLAMHRDAFGLYVTGTSMWPRFEEGEPVYVSASRPPAIGDYVVVELYPAADGDDAPGYLKRLLKRTATKIVCEQFNPPKEVEFDRDEVKALFRVIPLVELVGV